jgi:eukaryotic-like serine/threonine-protein kinase
MPSGDELAETAESGKTAGVTADTGSAPSTRPPGAPPMAGDTIGRYVIERVLGAGGMGVVYAAHDPDLDRKVALKLLHGAGSTTGAEARTRLLREARAMAKVNHPNVITVYEVGTAGGIDFVAMELIEGTNGADWLRKTKRTQPAILAMLTAAGRGLAAAHAMGLVHRDFKPANILISKSGKVVVTDFGLARGFDVADDPAATPPVHPERSPSVSEGESKGRSAAALEETVEATPSAATPTPSSPRSHSADLSSTITRTGALLGTPAYMAPEQFAGTPATPKADQYALAVAFWEGLAGARPFRGNSFDELKSAVDRGPASAADADKIPGRIRSILTRALSRDPSARYPDVDALLDALDRAQRRPRQLAFAAVVLVAAAGLAALFYYSRGKDTHTTVTAAAECGISDADMTQIWTPEIGARLGARIGDEKVWYKQGAAIEHLVATWKSERAETCAHPEAREFHGRVACLLSVRDEVGAVLDLAQTLPPDVIKSASVSEVLPDPTACRTGARAATPRLPDDPADRAAISSLYRDGVTAVIAARMGNAEQGRRIMRLALEKARASKNPLNLALALQSSATVEQLSGNCEGAETLFIDAAIAAESAQAGGIRAISTLGQLECFMKRSSDLDAIRRLGKSAEAAINGAGGDRGLRAALDMTMSSIDATAGDIDRAIDRAEAARKVFVETKDMRRAAVAAQTQAAYRGTRNAPGDWDQMLVLLREAASTFEESFGRTHPLTRDALETVAWRLMSTNPDEARTIFAELSAMPPLPQDPDASPLDTRGHAFGRVLGPDGKPVAGAIVDVGTFIIAGDDGLPFGVMFNGETSLVLTTDAAGRFDAHVPNFAIAFAHQGDLRAPPVHVNNRELTLRLAPGTSAEGTVEVRPAILGRDAERASILAARNTAVETLILGSGAGTLYQAVSRRTDDTHWTIHGLPPDAGLRATMLFNTALGDRVAIAKPLAASNGGPIALSFDLNRPTVDVIVRADSSAAIPTAQVAIFDGKIARLPTNALELTMTMGASLRFNVGNAKPVTDATRTQAGAKLYQPGDIHARLAAIGPGPVTACVVPFAGDLRDPAFLRGLPQDMIPDCRCAILDIAPAPAVQAFVVETPPMKRGKAK